MSNALNNPGEETPAAPIILVVEDDSLTRRAVGRKLQMAGYEVILLPSAAEALIVVQRLTFQVLVLDLQLMDGDQFGGIHDGLAVIDWLRHQLGELQFPIIIHTSQTDERIMQEAAARGAFAFCIKRRDLSNLVECIREALEWQKSRTAAA
jgi:CheY-like chemotaxis protein